MTKKRQASTLEELQKSVVRYSYHDVPNVGTFKIKRVGVTRKLEISALITENLDEDGKLAGEPEDHLRIWAQIMAKCLVDENDEYYLDNAEGVSLLLGIHDGFVEFRDEVDNVNHISARTREKEQESIKNA